MDKIRLSELTSIDNPSTNSSVIFQENNSQSHQGVYDQLNQFFSEQDKQRKTIDEARQILGESAQSLSDEQVYDLVNEVQFLVDTWIEEYERKIFDGKTLDELIKG